VGFLIAVIAAVVIFGLCFATGAVIAGVVAFLALLGGAATAGFVLAVVVTQDPQWAMLGAALGAGAMLVLLCKPKSTEGNHPLV
jgi:hypothetical protein